MKTKEEYVFATRKLTAAAQKGGIMTSELSHALSMAANNDPEFLFKITCQQLIKLGYSKLWREQPEVMQLLTDANKPLAKFIARAAIVLTATDKKKFNRTPQLGEDGINKWQVMDLIRYAIEDKLITKDEAALYSDLVDWEESNYLLVELDILKKVESFNYQQLKDNAPNVLLFIKQFYQDWVDLIIKPHQEAVKNGLKKVDK